MLDENIGYIQLSTFGDTTTEDLRTALEDLRSQSPTGLILDLRNNAGGGLNTGHRSCVGIYREGLIMYEEYGDGTRDDYNAIEAVSATEIPLVVLINEGSASASELSRSRFRIPVGGNCRSHRPLEKDQFRIGFH